MGCVGLVSPGVSTSPGQRPLLTWVPEQGVAAGQGNPAFSPVAGVFRAACSELCQALFGGILASDRRAIWHCTETQHSVHCAGARRDGKAVTHLPLPYGLGAGAGALLGTAAELCVPRWRDPGTPCPPGDRLSGSKKNEGLSGAAVFY